MAMLSSGGDLEHAQQPLTPHLKARLASLIFGRHSRQGSPDGYGAAAQVEKAQLQAEVAELQANHDSWAKAGMLGKLERRNPGFRPGIRVNGSAGSFESQGHSDYGVIQKCSAERGQAFNQLAATRRLSTGAYARHLLSVEM